MRRRWAVVLIVAIVAGLIAWSLAASYLFVQFGGLSGMLDQPWLAWWLYAANSPDGWTVTLLTASAVLPLLFVAVIALAVWRVRSAVQRVFPRSLYGDSAFASEAEQRAGGISTTRRLFK